MIYFIVGIVSITLGVFVTWKELARFKAKRDPVLLKVVEGVITSWFWLSIPLILIGIVSLLKGLRVI